MIPDGRDSVTCLSATVELSFGILLFDFHVGNRWQPASQKFCCKGLVTDSAAEVVGRQAATVQ